MDTVEELGGTYFYNGLINLTAHELLLAVFVQKTLEQLGQHDTFAATAILLGRRDQLTRSKPSGAISGTSRASKMARNVFKNSQFPFGMKMPSIVGSPLNLKTFKIRMVANIGTFAGRAIPVIGWIILAADVSIITINAMSAYNKIARIEDRL
ncbi:STM2901 family protein [Serratia marcescens]|uniref:STM2901 family protein n=1 Tax=Serratia marcescens TaxID=615 RepID=UPI00398958CE